MDSHERSLRTFLHRQMSDLDLKAPYLPSLMCEAYGRARGRTVELRPEHVPELGAFGVVMRLPQTDVIVYQAAVDEQHQTRIIFHEFIHLLCGHTSDSEDDGVLSCGPQALEDPRADNLYDSWQEWEAETGAAILEEWSDAAPAEMPNTLTEGVRRFLRGFAGEEWV